MRTYYVFIPGYQVTAEVEAPDTRHARTAFLDYLARNGYIRWSERGMTRKSMKTSRMRPGEYQTTISLTYGMQEPIEEAIPEPSTYQVPPEQPREVPEDEYSSVVAEQYEGDLPPAPPESEQVAPVETQPQDMATTVFGNSPIIKLSKRTLGNLPTGGLR